ncbi:MAG: ABC transporter substrate-binding protein [Candidatus Bathyarchaeia archaeon]
MAMRKRRNLIVVLAAIILIAAIVLSSFLYLNSTRYTGKVETITFGDLGVDSSELIYVAQNQHFFQQNGINFVIKTFETSTEADNAVLTSQADLATSGEYTEVTNAFANDNISVIANIDKYQGVYLIANKGHGIESVTDLVGKTIGVVFQSLKEYYLGSFLDVNGLSLSNVTLVNVQPSQWVSSIANGTVDAVVVSQNYISQVQAALPNNTIVWQVQGEQLAYALIYGQTSWITQNSDLVNRFLKSLVEAQNFVIQNPTSAKAVLQTRFNYTAAYLAQDWPNHQFSLSLDDSLILALEEEARWAISNNLVSGKTVPNFVNYIYINGLESVDSGSVDIIS